MGNGLPAYHAFHRGTPESDLRRWERQLRWLFEHPEPCVQLWAAVLATAILDLYRHGDDDLKRDAVEWFTADPVEYNADHRGSFLFVCQQLDLHDPDVVRNDALSDAGLQHTS